MNMTDYENIWKASLIHVTDEFSFPPVVLQAGETIIGTLGNFSVSTGKAKAKKTFNVSAIVAAALIYEKVLEYQASFPENKRTILYFDTEQSPYHCQLVMQRILRLAKLPIAKEPQNLKFSHLRAIADPNERREIISVQSLTNPYLLRYIAERGISLSIANRVCSEIRYNNTNRTYYAIGFANDAGGWEIRSPYFKGCIAPKTITTISKGTDVLQIFEGFMDFLSWQTLNLSSTCDTIVLNSLALLPRIQEKLKSYKQVESFLDNDEAGRKSFDVLKQFCPSIIDGSVRYRTHKDLNEWLVSQSKVQESQPSLPTTKRGIRR